MNLKGLRLNCWLAPACLTMLGAMACLVVGLWLARHAEHAAHRDLLATLAAYARLEEHGCRPPLGLWTGADARWQGAVEVRRDGDRWEIGAQAGSGWNLRPDDPPPALVLALHEPQAWTAIDGRRFAAAAARSGERPVFIIAWAPPAATAWLAPALGTASILAAAGLLLSWYLAARIWRPVESLARYAQAAADDAPAPQLHASVETGDLRSSITMLAERYRSSRNAKG